MAKRGDEKIFKDPRTGAQAKIIYEGPNRVLVTAVETPEAARGQGGARAVMSQVRDFLDANKLSARLNTIAYEEGVTVSGLQKLYASFGFEQVGKFDMERVAKTAEKVAATSNELFRDALLRRQIALASFERGLQTDIMDLLDKTEQALRVELADRLARLVGKDFGATVNSRLNVLANAIAKIRAGAFDEAATLWDSSMQDLAVAEAKYLDHHLKDVSPVRLDTVLPDATMLAGIVAVQPMQGKVLADWAEHIQERDLTRIMDAVKIGMAQGDTTDDIVRRVVGSQALDGADGVLQMSRRDAAAVTQTAISTIANAARGEYYAANEDILNKEQFVATLDDATCEECGALDGEEFDVGEGDQPPIHFNCRCVRVPVIDGTAIGDRPANAATADELDGLTGDERRARVSELVGTVPSSVNYSDWLGSQSDAFQDHVLGPSRGALFRDGGLSLDRFTNANGNTYNLDQLRALEPDAFKRAGL